MIPITHRVCDKGVEMRYFFILFASVILISYSGDLLAKEARSAQIANPASVKCIKDGHRLEIRKDAKGNEYGVCIDKKGRECEEWAYFRGECKLPKKSR